MTFNSIINFQLLLSIKRVYKNQTQMNNQQKQNKMLQRFRATMILAAVGDSIGYKGGKWEFNRDGVAIHNQLMIITNGGGIRELSVNKNNFPFSDDTVMHIATAKGLLYSKQQESTDFLLANIAKYYKKSMKFMSGRAPGNTCLRSARKLNEDGSNWKIVSFEKNGGGCGASMRSACIGLIYSNNLTKLIQISIQSGRITHHNPLGYLGSMVSAYFTSLAINNVHPYLWYAKLMSEAKDLSFNYIKQNRQSSQNLGKDWEDFWSKWSHYGLKRKLQQHFEQKNPSEPFFPPKYGVKQRQKAYGQLSINGWPGALGLDSVLIAYDALISTIYFSKDNSQMNKWQQICLRGMLHGGDSDSTGTIAAAWYGALFGFENVFNKNFENCQGKSLIQQLADKLYNRWVQINKNQIKN